MRNETAPRPQFKIGADVRSCLRFGGGADVCSETSCRIINLTIRWCTGLHRFIGRAKKCYGPSNRTSGDFVPHVSDSAGKVNQQLTFA